MEYFAVLVCVLAVLLRLLDGFWFAVFGPIVGSFVGAFLYSGFTFLVFSALFSKEIANKALEHFLWLILAVGTLCVGYECARALVSQESSAQAADNCKKFFGYVSGYMTIWYLTSEKPPSKRFRKFFLSRQLKLLLAKLQPRLAPVRR